MSPAPTIRAKVGNFPATIPVVGDEKTTLEAVRNVNKRLTEIENEGGPVNSHAFACRAAVTFAAELLLLEADQKEQDRQLLKALARVSDALRSVLRSAQPAPPDPKKR